MTQPFVCPECRANRPEDYHLDWCEYNGPDFGDEDEDEDDYTN